MKKALSFLSAVLLIIGLSACGSDTNNNNNDNEENNNVSAMENNENNENEENMAENDEIEETGSSNSEEEHYFDGTHLESEGFSIEITDHKVLQPGEGNNFGDDPIIGFWFDVTLDENSTEEDIDPNTAWIFTFEAIQDNDPNAINELNVGVLPDEDHLDSQSQTIKPGGTVSSSISYELTDEKTDVTIIAKEPTLSNDELGSFDYSIK